MEILYKGECVTIANLGDDDKSGWDLDLYTRESLNSIILDNIKNVDGVEHAMILKYTVKILIGKLYSKREVMNNIIENLDEIFNISKPFGLNTLSIKELHKRKEKAINLEDYELAQEIENILKNKTNDKE